jgi:hypothetical protein
MDNYSKVIVSVITVCVVMVTLIIVGSAISHIADHDRYKHGQDEYHEKLDHIIDRMENLEDKIDKVLRFKKK